MSRTMRRKEFDEAVYVRLPAGTRERIDAVRGGVRQGDFLRDLIMTQLGQIERYGSPAQLSADQNSDSSEDPIETTKD